MADYRRAFVPGGTYFFTVVTERRAAVLTSERARTFLHQAFETCRAARPFVIEAVVLLPDHVHTIWTLPSGDADYPARWAAIKAAFTRDYLESGGTEQRRTGSRVAQRRRGIWQRRFWEHAIRDERDFELHLNYIHYNPVRHGVSGCPHAWPYSTFNKWVARGVYKPDWCCSCTMPAASPADLSAEVVGME